MTSSSRTSFLSLPIAFRRANGYRRKRRGTLRLGGGVKLPSVEMTKNLKSKHSS